MSVLGRVQFHLLWSSSSERSAFICDLQNDFRGIQLRKQPHLPQFEKVEPSTSQQRPPLKFAAEVAKNIIWKSRCSNELTWKSNIPTMGDEAESRGGLPGDLRVMTVSFAVRPTFIILLVYDCVPDPLYRTDTCGGVKTFTERRTPPPPPSLCSNARLPGSNSVVITVNQV